MSPPPFALAYTAEAEKLLTDLLRTLKQLEVYGPRHPGLNSHPYKSVPGPGGATLWESYVESKTPGAWRIWWVYGPGNGQITIVTLGPHPD